MIYTDKMIKTRKGNIKKIHKILKIIIYPIIIAILLVILYLGYMRYVKHEKDVNIFGFRQYVVATGSMEPQYNIGDLIITREIPEEEIKIGDIINYISENKTDTITHRVVDIIEKDGQTYYKTKGDNNNSEDSELVQYSQIKGKLLFKVSKLGTLLTEMFTGTGIAILIIIIIISYTKDKDKEEKILARENARKLYNVPKYEENDT